MRLPDWIKTKSPVGLHRARQLLRNYGLSTVCEEARCPNIGVCFARPTATFMILGASCTRHCRFCSVESSSPLPPDSDEPLRVAMAARDMGLRYVVVTSVTRDDLPDGGAEHFARTIRAVKGLMSGTKVEVLVPDFKGDPAALGTVLSSEPDVLGHNVETIPALYPSVRPGADYERSLGVLRSARTFAPRIRTKSGLMVGLGESFDAVVAVMRDIRATGCDFLTIGQYLRPSKENLPVVEYIHPSVFDRYRAAAFEIGFSGVASFPLARSSMNAEEMFLNGEDRN
ncbi:MAG TPA: lipoyl synthase [Dissulfurispiraceae bacterium]